MTETHNSQDAVKSALTAAEARCVELGVRMTPWRRKVLALLLEEHRALGAYEILDLLRISEGSQVRPPIAYRALDFLTEHGFAHKIERISAFVACDHPGEHHSPAFLICRKCKAVGETHVTPTEGALGTAADHNGFQIERTLVEAIGLCRNCSTPAVA